MTLWPLGLRARSRLLTLLLLSAFGLLALLLLRPFSLLTLLALLLLLSTLHLLSLLLRALDLFTLLLRTFDLLLHRPAIRSRLRTRRIRTQRLWAWCAVGTRGAIDCTTRLRLTFRQPNIARARRARRWWIYRGINATGARFWSRLRRPLGAIADLGARAAHLIGWTLNTWLLTYARTLNTIGPVGAFWTVANFRTIDPLGTTDVARTIRASGFWPTPNFGTLADLWTSATLGAIANFRAFSAIWTITTLRSISTLRWLQLGSANAGRVTGSAIRPSTNFGTFGAIAASRPPARGALRAVLSDGLWHFRAIGTLAWTAIGAAVGATFTNIGSHLG